MDATATAKVSPATLRELLLLLFLGTTYLVAPVGGFATLLCVLGFAQSEERRWHRAYLLLFLLSQLIPLLPRLVLWFSPVSSAATF